MAENVSKDNYTFYDNVSSINSNTKAIYNVNCDASEMNISFKCTGTFQAKIYAAIMDITDMKAYPCFQLPSFTLIENFITDASCLYNVDISGIDYLKVELISLTGNIIVRAKVVG